MALLGPGDPPPFSVRNPDGKSDLLFISDHNGLAIPKVLGDLGVPPNELRRHVAYDIGIEAVATALSNRFNAPLVMANFSRLVIDCNRAPGAPDSIPAMVDHTQVPANDGITGEDRAAREREIFSPYHRAIDAKIAAMRATGTAPVLISLHSFTPVINRVFRPWNIGILWNRDGRLALPLIEALSTDPALTVGDNLPYSGRGSRTFSTRQHAETAGLVYVGVEFRQDQIEFRSGADAWACRFGDALAGVLAAETLNERRIA